MSLIRKPAPGFVAPAWYNGDFVDIDLKSYHGKYVVLFFYPLDFTFVCPTEIIAFNNKAKEFREIGCELIAVSVDSKFSHMEYTLKSRKEGGLGPMDIPLVSDLNKTISSDYGCLCDIGDVGVSYRATYIIDKNGIVRHSSINDLPVGRNPDEYLRLVKAFQYVDVHGEVCPANWQPGSKTMIPDPKKNNYKEVINEAK
jgi:peroxiredoxin (alkyl hydroperoxide reductase subunit C)